MQSFCEFVDLSHVNYYQGVYYFTRADADAYAEEVDGTVEKRTRGFVVLVHGTPVGPTDLTEDVQMAVASANLQSFRYDETTNTLTIKFRSGAVYRYADVPADVVDEMRWAESRGRYFHRFIRYAYSYSQIEAPRPGFTNAHNTAKSSRHLRHTLKVPKFTHKLPRLS